VILIDIALLSKAAAQTRVKTRGTLQGRDRTGQPPEHARRAA